MGQQNIPLEMVRYKEKLCPKKDNQKARGTTALGHFKKLKVWPLEQNIEKWEGLQTFALYWILLKIIELKG